VDRNAKVGRLLAGSAGLPFAIGGNHRPDVGEERAIGAGLTL
jgi:hypothetical protein